MRRCKLLLLQQPLAWMLVQETSAVTEAGVEAGAGVEAAAAAGIAGGVLAGSNSSSSSVELLTSAMTVGSLPLKMTQHLQG
jgi:hypothetical protein